MTTWPEVLDFGGLAKRPDHVADGVAFLQRAQPFGGGAYYLDDQGDGATFGVAIGNGQRDTFAAAVGPHDDEVTGAMPGRYPRCFNFQTTNLGCKPLGFQDAKHQNTSLASEGAAL